MEHVKKRYLAFILLLTVLDWFCLINWMLLLMFPFWVFAVLHAALMGMRRRLADKYDEDELFFPLLCWVLPGIGLTMQLGYLALQWTWPASELVQDEDIDDDGSLDAAHLFGGADMDQELGILSIEDSLSLGSEHDKKKALMSFANVDTRVKVRVLRKALQDDSPEVVHYAASHITMIEDELTRQIQKLKQDYLQKEDVDSLLQLAKAEMTYLSSGLLDGGLIRYYLAEYLEVLEKLEKRQSGYNLSLNKAYAWAQLRHLDEATGLLQQLISRQPRRYEAYIQLMSLYFDKADDAEVRSLATRLKNKKIKLPEEVRQILNYWTAGDKS